MLHFHYDEHEEQNSGQLCQEFPCIDNKKTGHTKIDRTVFGSTWQKVIEKMRNSDFDMEVEEAKVVFVKLKKYYQRESCSPE